MGERGRVALDHLEEIIIHAVTTAGDGVEMRFRPDDPDLIDLIRNTSTEKGH